MRYTPFGRLDQFHHVAFRTRAGLTRVEWLLGHALLSFPLCRIFQLETLETILGPTRNGSAFYQEPDSRAGKEMGSKQANLPDSLHGKYLGLL